MKRVDIKIIFCLAILTCRWQTGLAQKVDSVAENMLVYQRTSGGWPKSLSLWPINYHRRLTADQKKAVIADTKHYEATIDNDATTPEITYLVKAYRQTGNKDYLTAAQKGIDYLLKAQYGNGGWPQFYPVKKGYYTHITYNDNAMVHVMKLLQAIVDGTDGFDVVSKSFLPKARMAVAKGIDCFLKTQVSVNGKLTVWCAQHDEQTLLPAPARAFELVSLSGLESVGIVEFLMTIKNPSPQIRQSITSAVAWFNQSRIEGYDFVLVPDSTQAVKGQDAILVADPKSTIWARFYDIDTNEPFFVGKDGIARKKVSQIENERRAGYAWYGKWPAHLIEKEFPDWVKKNGGAKSAPAPGHGEVVRGD